ncbi:MAG: isopeptide-forming domain-containing fimbrial protein [Eubacteriales bacterium]|nr:isopeptide-forming domain-containing fimbrial protein [Eubacteriales bacterium]
MKKTFKKIAGLLLAMVMVFAMTATVFAEGENTETTYSITIKNESTGHIYEAYQILKGDLHEGTLSNIEWGSGVNDAGKAELGDAKANADSLKTSDDAAQFAKSVASYLTTSAASSSFIPKNEEENTEAKYVISGLAAGYYLIKDKDKSLENPNDSYTRYILKVVGNVEADPKSDVPSSDKKVKDINDTTGESTDWQDSADYDIGDNVPFRLTATLPNNVSYYDKYKLVFKDTQSKGLTYTGKATVKVNGVKVGQIDPVIENYAASDEDDIYAGGKTLTFTIDNVKADPYNAGDSAVITIEYNSTLNGQAVIGSAGNPNKMHIEYSNNPNDSNETGKTPDDTVIVFTYKTIVNKVDKDGKALPGAEFTLEKKVKDTSEAGYKWASIQTVKNTEGTIFTFAGLDDGDYRLTETETPKGYNTISPIEFTISADHDIISDNPALNTLTGTGESEITFTPNITNGSLESNIVNYKGTELPSTGGMGTRIFTVSGLVIMIGAALLLVTKKRMSIRK